jgi:hypothetical protein
MGKPRYFRKRILGSLLMLTMLMLLFGYGSDAWAGLAAADIQPLVAKARADGAVRVIVGFDVGFQPEGKLAAALVQTQRDLIALSQDEVLYQLASHNVTGIKRAVQVHPLHGHESG